MSVKIDINILQSSLIIHKCFWSSITGPMPYSLCDFHWEMLYKHALLFFFFFQASLFQVMLCMVCECTWTRMFMHMYVVYIYVHACALFSCSYWSFCLQFLGGFYDHASKTIKFVGEKIEAIEVQFKDISKYFALKNVDIEKFIVIMREFYLKTF